MKHGLTELNANRNTTIKQTHTHTLQNFGPGPIGKAVIEILGIPGKHNRQFFFAISLFSDDKFQQARIRFEDKQKGAGGSRAQPLR